MLTSGVKVLAEKPFDVAIVGAGQAGTAAALSLLASSRIVERHFSRG